MVNLVHNLIADSAKRFPDRPALKYLQNEINYRQLHEQVSLFSSSLIHLGLKRSERVAIYAEKRLENVIAMFGAAKAGGVYVPVNPLLKADQLSYILTDCNVRVLVTTSERLSGLSAILPHCPELTHIVYIGQTPNLPPTANVKFLSWNEMQSGTQASGHRVIDQDMAAILYTSGSTGKPKGVVLSHRNIVTGAQSVAEYLELTHHDRLLSVLPLSFDYGMNQLTTMFLVGGMAVLMNYLFPRDIITTLDKEKITGLAAVPPLWIQLSQLPWPTTITEHLRYFTNSGGHMPKETLNALRTALPKTKPFLMYGLTESFRSTYLPPAEIDKRPDSMGKAIPNAEIYVVRPDGSPCAPHEPGELVHRGPLVSLGYWNDPAKTAERFKPLPNQNKALPFPELAVWSGDTVKMDEDGYLYFVSRNDEMIKTSGYRVSPTEVEEFLYNTKLIEEAAAFGITHPVLGQVIGVIVSLSANTSTTSEALKLECQKHLPNYMIPAHIEILPGPLPRNSNGKIDRKLLATERQHLFKGSAHG
jgi:acyl-CoA ligase (AMP-forming) (exosortase A-associated)